MAMAAKHIPTYDEYIAEIKKREDEKAAREAKSQPKDFSVYRGGAPVTAKMGLEGSHGWNTGDIDFDDDGSIFIRNPYLANAIEHRLSENYKKWKDHMEKKQLGTLPRDAEEPVLFRLTRDEGWSGEKQNVVC